MGILAPKGYSFTKTAGKCVVKVYGYRVRPVIRSGISEVWNFILLSFSAAYFRVWVCLTTLFLWPTQTSTGSIGGLTE